MKALIKTDFEKYLLTLLTKTGNKFYKTIDTKQVYFWFEGQTIMPSDYFVSLQILPSNTERITTGVKFHTGSYKFFIYALDPLSGDKIVDGLSVLFDELTIEKTAGFRIETDIMNTIQRGNKLSESTHYETIVQLNYFHWEC